MLKNNRPDWWPKNPYPENIFTWEIEDYIKAIPDDVLRTKISGVLGGFFWDIADKQIHDAFKANIDCKDN